MGALIAVGAETVSETAALAVYAVVGLGVLVLLPRAFVVTVRRLHDTGRSGWFILFPYIGGFILLYFTVLNGDTGPSAYGPDPKDPYTADEPGLEDSADVLGD